MDRRNLGLGLAGAVDRSVVRRVAALAETKGFATFWLNDTPEGDSLAGLAEAARATTSIRLGTGVIPLDRQDAAAILRRVADLQLPESRLTIGVGSGSAMDARSLVTEQVELLKRQSQAQIYLGALGPRMRALAVDIADGILLNMLPVHGAEQAVADMQRTARERGREPIKTALYVRVSLGSAARARLEDEAARYERFPSYAANFARLGARAIDTAVIGASAADIQRGLAPYRRAVDETVVRAITAHDTVEEYEALVNAVTSE